MTTYEQLLEADTYSGGEGHCARKVKASVSEF